MSDRRRASSERAASVPAPAASLRVLAAPRRRIERLLEGRAGDDADALERLCRYAARPPLANERLEERPDGTLALRLKILPGEAVDEVDGELSRPGGERTSTAGRDTDQRAAELARDPRVRAAYLGKAA